MYCIFKCAYSIAKYKSLKKRGITLINIGFVSQSTFQVGSLLSFSTVTSPSAAVQKENLCWPHLEARNMVGLIT